MELEEEKELEGEKEGFQLIHENYFPFSFHFYITSPYERNRSTYR